MIHQDGIDAWPDRLSSWMALPSKTVPWRLDAPLSFEDTIAACYEHLERLADKRFPTEWNVYVWSTVEQAGISMRYEIESGSAEKKDGQWVRSHSRRNVGTLRVRRLKAELTRLEANPSGVGDENDAARLQAIIGRFAERWRSELPDQPQAIAPSSTGGSQRDDGRQRLRQLKEDSKRFLIALAEQANFSTVEYIRMRDVVETIGVTEKRSYELEDYLDAKGWLKRETMGGIDGSLRIMPDGLSQVELWLSEAKETRPTSEPHAPVTVAADLARPDEVRLQQRPSGRRPDAIYDEAFRILLQGNATESAYRDAYEYTCKARPIDFPTIHDWNAFKKAMKSRLKKWEKTGK